MVLCPQYKGGKGDRTSPAGVISWVICDVEKIWLNGRPGRMNSDCAACVQQMEKGALMVQKNMQGSDANALMALSGFSLISTMNRTRNTVDRGTRTVGPARAALLIQFMG
jgi:hypothetical protein